VAVALAGAFAILLAWPGNGPTGQVLDLVGGEGAGAAVIGQEPTPAGSPQPPAVAALPKPTPAGSLPPSALAALPHPTVAGLPEPTPVALAEPTPAVSPVLLPALNGATSVMRFGENMGTKAPPVAGLVGYVWPLAHPRLTLPFGPTVWGSRWVNGESFHDGVDLATFCGDRVVAAHAGLVLAASRHYDAYMGWIGDTQPYLKRLDKLGLWMTLPIVVVIDDGNGYRSIYAHFGRVIVKPGQQVKAGQLIGYEGMTGRATGCHVHYGLFSPWEQATMAIKADVVKRMKVPKTEIARIDPLPVLPPKAGINAPAKPKASAATTASASPKP